MKSSNVVVSIHQALPARRPSVLEVPEAPFLSSFQKIQQSNQKYKHIVIKRQFFLNSDSLFN